MALVLAGGAVDRASGLQSPEQLAPNTVARVSDVPPRFGTVTIGELRHALVLAAAQEGRRTVPRPGRGGYGRLERRAVDSLLEIAWIHGLAVEWGIAVTPGEVKRELIRIKKESFKSAAEYREFLKESRYTRRDVSERVEIQLLSTRIQERLERQIDRETRTRSERQRAFTEFVAEFNEEWRARTVCAPQYATERCSNGPPSSIR